MTERQYCEFDFRYLIPFLRGKAKLDDPRFRELYFAARDVWDRLQPGGAMPAARLQLMVEQYEALVAEPSPKPEPPVRTKKEKVPA